jgi:hypothetical protein
VTLAIFTDLVINFRDYYISDYFAAAALIAMCLPDRF